MSLRENDIFGADLIWCRCKLAKEKLKANFNLLFSKFSNYRKKINLAQPENFFFYTDLILACLIVTNAPNFLCAKISSDKLVYEHYL